MRLYDAIEAGVADLDDPALKERVTSLNAIRTKRKPTPRVPARCWRPHRSKPSPHRWSGRSPGRRERIRIDGGGYRRDHFRAFAQRVEVADPEVRIHRLEKQSASDTERGRRRKAGYARRSQFRFEVAEA